MGDVVVESFDPILIQPIADYLQSHPCKRSHRPPAPRVARIVRYAAKSNTTGKTKVLRSMPDRMERSLAC